MTTAGRFLPRPPAACGTRVKITSPRCKFMVVRPDSVPFPPTRAPRAIRHAAYHVHRRRAESHHTPADERTLLPAIPQTVDVFWGEREEAGLHFACQEHAPVVRLIRSCIVL